MIAASVKRLRTSIRKAEKNEALGVGCSEGKYRHIGLLYFTFSNEREGPIWDACMCWRQATWLDIVIVIGSIHAPLHLLSYSVQILERRQKLERRQIL